MFFYDIAVLSPNISILSEGDSVQGTEYDLIGWTAVDQQLVDSKIEFITNWTRLDGKVNFKDVAVTSKTSISQSPFSNTLAFAPLRNNNVDGGVYVFSVQVQSVDSQYIIPGAANRSFSLVIDNYPSLNITKIITTDECNRGSGAELVGSIEILNTTFSNASVTYTWKQSDQIVRRPEGSLVTTDSYMIPSVTESAMYDLEVCLTIFKSGLQNHCSNTTYDVIVSGKNNQWQLIDSSHAIK